MAGWGRRRFSSGFQVPATIFESEGSSSLAADVVLAETHHAARAGEPGLIYQDSLFEAASRSLRGALFLRERSFDPKPLTKGRLVRGGRES
jgi:hypothetical protein